MKPEAWEGKGRLFDATQEVARPQAIAEAQEVTRLKVVADAQKAARKVEWKLYNVLLR